MLRIPGLETHAPKIRANRLRAIIEIPDGPDGRRPTSDGWIDAPRVCIMPGPLTSGCPTGTKVAPARRGRQARAFRPSAATLLQADVTTFFVTFASASPN